MNNSNYEFIEQIYKDGTFKSSIPVTKANEKYLSLPPLSELIKGCGDLFFQLTKGSGDLWYAEGDTEDYPKYTAFTPEDAVAKLWLAINTK